MSLSKEYIQYIKDLNIGQASYLSVWLMPELRTTEIMTRLKHRRYNCKADENCKDPFDVLYLTVYRRKYKLLETFVIIYIPSSDFASLNTGSDFIDKIYTFTSLKKHGMDLLCKACEDAFKLPLSNGTVLSLWEKPYILEAVTNYDKDFRKEWDSDGSLVYEGNEYGDTSSFWIIGHIDHSD